MSRLAHPFFRGLTAPLHISHRGGAGLFPENTLAAFEGAVTRFGTDMLELDLHTTKDGVLVVAHDDTVDRCTDGLGRIDAVTAAELSRLDAGYRFSPAGGEGHPFRGQGITLPTFDEVLRRFPAIRINVELKCDAALGPVVDRLKTEPALLSRLCLGSEHDALAAALAAAVPDACLFFPRDALAAFVLPVKGGDAPEDDPRYAVLDMPWEWMGARLFDVDVATAARDRGVWVNVWTVDDEATMREALACGVGGIMTDRPDVLRSVLERLG